MAKIKLTDQHRQLLNEQLKEVDDVKKDAETAHKAGVPSMEPIIERCVSCRDSIVRLKKTYFPNKP